MGVFYEAIPENISQWILLQKLFWVATAPLAAAGHVNVSPKGGAYFGLLDARTFWYMDLSGSGCETIAHLRENGRITVMFNAFEGSPRIVRLWGRGRVLEREGAAFRDFVEKEGIEVIPATRSVVLVDVHQVGSSCGYSVPFFEFREFRKTLNQVFEKREKDLLAGDEEKTMDRYWAYKNAWSVDGLPGMQRGQATGITQGVAPIAKMVGPSAPIDAQGPGSSTFNAKLRHHFALLRRVQFDAASTVVVALVMFLLGVAVALYGPDVLQKVVERRHSPRLSV